MDELESKRRIAAERFYFNFNFRGDKIVASNGWMINSRTAPIFEKTVFVENKVDPNGSSVKKILRIVFVQHSDTIAEVDYDGVTVNPKPENNVDETMQAEAEKLSPKLFNRPTDFEINAIAKAIKHGYELGLIKASEMNSK